MKQLYSYQTITLDEQFICNNFCLWYFSMASSYFSSLICFKSISLSLENTEVLLTAQHGIIHSHLQRMPYILGTLFRSARKQIFFCSLIQRDIFCSFFVLCMGITFLHTKAPVLRELAPEIKYLDDNIHLHSILETSTCCQTELLSLQRLSQNSLYLLQSSYPFLNIQYFFKTPYSGKLSSYLPYVGTKPIRIQKTVTDSLSKHDLLQS